MITIYEGTDDECKLYLAKIDNICSDMKFNKIVDNFEHKVAYITNQKEKFYFKTNYNAQNKQIMLMDLNHPEKKDWKTIVPETKNPMTFAYCFNDKYFLIGYSIDVIDVIQMNKIDNGEFIKNIELPSLGTVGLSLQKHQEEFFFKFTSFLYPGTIFRYSLANNISECFKEIKVPNFNRDNFNTEQIFYQSKDGTKIPMFLIYRKGLELNGNNPFFLYGYGGFDISIKPSFSSMDICLMENLNVSMAIANIRGGGEYGDFWHESAKKEKKQNCFDDFHFAAEYLIKNKYTSPEKLVINGASNGGLLVAVCANQRPDLYSCVIVSQGVLDMLRYHLYTIGYAWKTEYGDPDIPEDFNYLIKYSPIHNVNEKGKYPAILVRTSDFDDRVVPVHSYKYISVLQEKLENNEKPLMILIEKKAGHGAGKPTQKRIDDCSNNFTFIALTLGLEYEEK